MVASLVLGIDLEGVHLVFRRLGRAAMSVQHRLLVDLTVLHLLDLVHKRRRVRSPGHPRFVGYLVSRVV